MKLTLSAVFKMISSQTGAGRKYSPREIVFVVVEQQVKHNLSIFDDIEHRVLQFPQQRLSVFVFLQLHYLKIRENLAVRLNSQLQSSVPFDFLFLVGLNHLGVVLDLIANPVNGARAEGFGDEMQLEAIQAVEFEKEADRPEQVRLVVATALAQAVIPVKHSSNLSRHVVEGRRENLDAKLS